MSWGVLPWVYPVWDSLGFLDINNFSDRQKVKDYSNTLTRISIERSSPNRKEARIFRKGKTTIGEVNI